MKISEFVQQVKQGSIDIVEYTHKALEEIKKINSEYNYFSTICEQEAITQAEQLKKTAKRYEKEYAEKTRYKRKLKQLTEAELYGEEYRLLGVPISIKDCICVKGIETTAGSKVLQGYKPLFNATVVEKLKQHGAIIVGKTSQDEFGFGSFNTNVGLGFNIPKNPFDKTRCTGGSSGGSAGITQKTKLMHVSIAESTGGSIAFPAGFCGAAGLTPTYGRVSRYGLIDYANSLDKIGTMAKNVHDNALLLEIIAGKDIRDSTAADKETEQYAELLKKEARKLKVGIIKELLESDEVHKDIQKSVWNAIKKLESFGIGYEEISLPFTAKYSLPAYYLIATAEASTNLAKFCGMRYGLHEKLEGNFNDYFIKVRSQSLGKEAKRRIMLGTFARMAGYRNQYYIKAMRLRTKIIQEYKQQFKKVNCLLSPVSPVIAPKFSEIEKLTPMQNYLMDIMTVGPNLAGLPHLSVNAGYSKGMPIGAMIIGDHFGEEKILRVGNLL